jgi:hypothetical protein
MASIHCSPLEEGMTTMQRDPLVDDYLRRLEAAAADLPDERRAVVAERTGSSGH